MSVAYKALYGVGFTPWEQITTLPGVTSQSSALFDREEQGRQRPTGRHSTSAAAAGSGRSGWRSGGGRSRVSTSCRRLYAGHASGHGQPVSRYSSSTAT